MNKRSFCLPFQIACYTHLSMNILELFLLKVYFVIFVQNFKAMSNKIPVVGTNTGGLLESIVDGKTGYLCEPNKEAFGKAVEKIIGSETIRKRMGEAGHDVARKKFSEEMFRENINKMFDKSKEKNDKKLRKILKIAFVLLMFGYVLTTALG